MYVEVWEGMNNFIRTLLGLWLLIQAGIKVKSKLIEWHIYTSLYNKGFKSYPLVQHICVSEWGQH